MHIDDIATEVNATGTLLRAAVDDFELRFQFRGEFALPNRVEAVLTSVVVPAMAKQEPLTLAPRFSVSGVLLENLKVYQAVLEAWYSAWKAVPITATVRGQPVDPAYPGSSVCLFSGGVDSMHAFLENLDTISHGLFVCGFDVQPGQRDRLEQARRLNANVVEQRYGKALIDVETNLKQFMSRYGVGYFQGPGLIAIALALGFRSTIVPASHTMTELAPWDSHPMIDGLLRTERCATVHYGAIRRSRKIQAISQFPGALDDLRVCNASDQYNCGRCEKCLRTIVALELLGLRSGALPPFSRDTVRLLNRLTLYHENAVTYWLDNVQLARSQGRSDLARIIGRRILGYQTRMLLRAADAQWFNGRLSRSKQARSSRP